MNLLDFHIALYADQLLYSLSLIKICSACTEQNAALNTSDAYSLLGK